MSSGQDLVEAAQTMFGQPYDTNPDRLDPNHWGTDCSGLVFRAYLMLGLGCPTVSVTQYQFCRDVGELVTRDTAFDTAGSLLFCPENPELGWGSAGHVGFSNGDGTTTESTPFYRGGVQILPVTAQPWSTVAGLLPDINYGPILPLVEDDDMSILFQTPTSISVLNPPIVTAVAPEEVGPLNALVAAGLMKLKQGTDAELAQYLGLYRRYLSTLPTGGGGSASVDAILDGMSARLSS